jgi:hypothetical protein
VIEDPTLHGPLDTHIINRASEKTYFEAQVRIHAHSKLISDCFFIRLQWKNLSLCTLTCFRFRKKEFQPVFFLNVSCEESKVCGQVVCDTDAAGADANSKDGKLQSKDPGVTKQKCFYCFLKGRASKLFL